MISRFEINTATKPRSDVLDNKGPKFKREFSVFDELPTNSVCGLNPIRHRSELPYRLGRMIFAVGEQELFIGFGNDKVLFINIL